jgi:small subunit ribosomal protein S12
MLKIKSYKSFRKVRKFKKSYTRTPLLLGCPQKRGLCRKVTWGSPKKPNSARRKLVRVVLRTHSALTAYIPGERHNLQNYSSVLIRGGRVKDMPGVNYRVVRGAKNYDSHPVMGRSHSRSKYGCKWSRGPKIVYERK